jgi:ankyrin repeat protein
MTLKLLLNEIQLYKEFLKDPGYIHFDGNNWIGIACRSQNLELLNAVLENKQCDTKYTNIDGDTALHIVCRYRDPIFLDVLLKKKIVDINSKNKNGDTPLHIACQNSDKTCVFKLLEYEECNVGILNNQSRTPLISACASARGYESSGLEIVTKLLEKKDCKLDHVDDYGNTALIRACFNSNAYLVDLLLKYGDCNFKQKNKKDKTAYDYAVIKLTHWDVTEKIKKKTFIDESVGYSMEPKKSWIQMCFLSSNSYEKVKSK